MKTDSPYLFYVLDCASDARDPKWPSDEYEIVWWRPSLISIRPSGFGIVKFSIWWLFHYLGLFFNGNYTLAAVYEDGELVHHSCIFPGNFRFPFMRRADLQVGDVWTSPGSRGRGLAGAVLAAIGSRFAGKQRIWYLVDEDNLASIRIAEKAGFTLHARGRRVPRFGVHALGYYEITVIHAPASIEADAA